MDILGVQILTKWIHQKLSGEVMYQKNLDTLEDLSAFLQLRAVSDVGSMMDRRKGTGQKASDLEQVLLAFMEEAGLHATAVRG